MAAKLPNITEIDHLNIGTQSADHTCRMAALQTSLGMTIVKNLNQEYRLIEIGDGQVSDYKKWESDKFVSIFK